MSNCFICISSPCETVILHRDLESYSPTPHTHRAALHFYMYFQRERRRRRNASNPKKERRHIQIKTRTLVVILFFYDAPVASALLQYRKHARFLYWQDASASHSLLIILEIQETGTENDKMFWIYIFPPFFLSLHLPQRLYERHILQSTFFYDLPSAVCDAPGRVQQYAKSIHVHNTQVFECFSFNHFCMYFHVREDK